MSKQNLQRRQKLIASAKHFLYKSYDNTLVNDLIRLVGVSKGAFYLHLGGEFISIFLS